VTPSESLTSNLRVLLLAGHLVDSRLDKGTGVAKVGWGRPFFQPSYFQLDTWETDGIRERAFFAKWWFSSRGADFQPLGDRPDLGSNAILQEEARHKDRALRELRALGRTEHSQEWLCY
jgi:hypothetical protein